MRGRAPILIAAAVAAAVAVGLILRSPRTQRGSAEERFEPLLPSLSGPCASLAIRNDSLDASLRSVGGAWRLEKPVREKADSSAVASILRVLASARVLRTVERDAADRSPYGLDAPRVELAAGESRLRLGRLNPTRDGLYADRPPSRDVVLADLSLLPLLNVPLAKLRDRSAVVFPAERVRRLDVRRGETRWTVERSGAGDWSIAELGARADGRAAAGLLDALRAVRIHSYQDSIAFAPAAEEIAYGVVYDGGEARLRIGAPVPETSLFECEAGDRGSPFRVARHFVDSLAARAGRLVDTRVFLGGLIGADRVVVDRASSPFALVRVEEGRWRLEAGETLPVYGPHVRAFLRNLENLRAARVLPPGEAAFPERPAWTVEAGREGVGFGETRGLLVARREGETGVLVLDPSAKRLLETPVGDLLEPVPARPGAEQRPSE